MNTPPSHYTKHETYKKTFENMKDFFYGLYKQGYVTKVFTINFVF